MKAADDVELVRRFQRGEAAAFVEFADRHRDRVYRVARLWLSRPADAEDVVQEVFVRSLSGLSGFLFRAQPSTWLLRVTRNVCHEANRKHRWHLNVDDPLLQPSLLHEEGARSGSGPGADDDHARVRRAVRRLPARQQEVVVLRVFEELSVAETARALGCREGTVKAHLNKAVGNLRRLLASPE